MAKTKTKLNRGFREVRKQFKKHDKKAPMPVRSDKKSAGYDFYSMEKYVLAPNQTKIFWTDVKAFMMDDEVLMLHVRSSVGIKKGIVLANGTGIIDASYYNNKDNDGNIGIALHNSSQKPVAIREGDRIAQGIFIKYLVAEVEEVLNDEREGGIGSSGE